MEKMVLKEGMSLFMNGNGPKPNLNELKKDLKTKIEAIKLVDKSEIKVGEKFITVPDKYFEQSRYSNIAIEMFIGFAKREDSPKEEVEILHNLVMEVVEMDCEVFGSNKGRIKYLQDLKVLIDNKNAIVLTHLSNDQLLESFKSWFEVWWNKLNITNLRVTVLDLVEGKDQIREKYQENYEKKCKDYMSEQIKGMGISEIDIMTNPSIRSELSPRLKEFENDIMQKYFEESLKYLKENYPIKEQSGDKDTRKLHPRRLRITSSQRVVEQLTKEEIIEEAEKYWKPLYEEGKIELGKAVVLFPSIEFNEVAYVLATNLTPQPILVEFKKGWRKSYKEFKSLLEEKGLYIIETNDSGHRKVSSEFEKKVMKEVERRMRMNRYN